MKQQGKGEHSSLRDDSGQRYDTTSGLGPSNRGACTEDRNISILGIDYPRIYLLSRREKCTRVYTSVYPRVYNSVHACTHLRSKYVRSRALIGAVLGANT